MSQAALQYNEDGTLRTCGAATMRCFCNHMRREHKRVDGKFVGCSLCDACTQFKGRPHTQSVGLMANGRCRLHGGLTPTGIASPHYKMGDRVRRGIPLPDQLAQTFAKAFADPELLSLRRQIALHEAREEELTGQLTDGASVAASVGRTWTEMKAARRMADAAAIAEAWNAHDAAIASDSANGAIWTELRREALLIAKLKDRENERLERLHQRLSREQAIAFIRAMSLSVRDAVTENVLDSILRASVLRAVASRFALLTQGGGTQDPDAGGRTLTGELRDPTTEDG